MKYVEHQLRIPVFKHERFLSERIWADKCANKYINDNKFWSSQKEVSFSLSPLLWSIYSYEL